MTVPHRLRLPAEPPPPPRGRLPFADVPGASDPIEVNSRRLTRGGRPWFPVSGEFLTHQRDDEGIGADLRPTAWTGCGRKGTSVRRAGG